MRDDRITLCFPLAGDTLGGSHFSLRGLLEGLSPLRYRVLIIIEVPGGQISEFFKDFEQIADPAAPARPLAAGKPFGPLSALRVIPGIERRRHLLREHKVDIVHTNDGRSHATWALAARLAGTPLVWHHRGDPKARGLNYVAPLLANRILAVSQFALPKRRWGALRGAQIVHSPFDTGIPVDRAAMREKLIEELGCPQDTVLCGYFGLFIDRKRPLGFVDAILELQSICDRPVLGLLFGEANDARTMKSLNRKIEQDASDGQVRLMGFRRPGHAWISGCDLLLVPAIHEPLGRTLVEAMLVKTPVVATASGGNTEALEGGLGLLVEPDNPAAMANAANDLLAEPARILEMTERARKAAIANFASERHCRQVEQIYAGLIGKLNKDPARGVPHRASL